MYGISLGAQAVQVEQVTQLFEHRPDTCSLWRRRHSMQAQRENTYGALRSLDVFTVTGVPRREPCRPYGRTVSPERELHELSVLPWRSMVVSFFVILATGSAALPDAKRLRVVSVGAAVGAGDSC